MNESDCIWRLRNVKKVHFGFTLVKLNQSQPSRGEGLAGPSHKKMERIGRFSRGRCKATETSNHSLRQD